MTKYYLIKKNGEVETFYGFADLVNAYKDEYGELPGNPSLQEGAELYYQG